MVVFLVPPHTVAELEEDFALLRSACAGSNDPTLEGFLTALASLAPSAGATADSVESAWRAALDDAQRTLVRMKKTLAGHIRDRTEPPGLRDRLKGFASAVDQVKRRRELKKSIG